jgi:hypothetical protein
MIVTRRPEPFSSMPHLPGYSSLRKGRQRLFLHPGLEADGRIDSSTMGNVPDPDEMDRLEKVRSVWGDLSGLD